VVGYTVVRVTHRQLTEEPETVVDRLRRMLG
jgi:very-short-patch-repair endonuclease